jgi:AraC family transcriptional regulator, arabinose operon regulatory protein
MANLRNEYCPPAEPIAAGHHPMPAGCSIARPNGVDAWLLHYTLGGTARFTHARGSFAARSGDFVLIEPGTPQQYGTEGSLAWDPLWVVFSAQPHWPELLAWPEMGPGHRRLGLREKAARRQIENKLWETLKLTAEAPRNRGAFGLNALEAVLLWCSVEVSLAGTVPWDARLQRAVSCMYEHFGRALSLGEVARVAGVSMPHLSRLFRMTLKTSPGKFLEQVRMDRARELLTYTSMNVQAIAANTGFENPFYFTNRFRKAVGVSPRTYRQALLKSNDGKISGGVA